MNATAYRKMQIGYAVIVILGIALLVEIVVERNARQIVPLIGLKTLLVAGGAIFSTMTVSVSQDHVEWWFTFGVLRQRIALTDVVFAISKRITLANGLGIRTNGRDWLWTVGGGEAVELKMRDGRRVAFGSPEAQRVVLLIEDRLGSRG